ncbi:pre-mRNA-splicing factor Cwf15/Cwc15 [Chloropicon primus]|nr:pre-mRNA-splicing factor Cwf15/Cwc15 [Chloropicon primus]
MTSAARPTWAPAKGSEDQGGSKMFGSRTSYSSKDLPGHKELKSRALGQDGAEEVGKRDLKRELLEKEAKHFANKPELLAAKQLKIQALEHKIKVPGVVDAEFAATGDLVTREADADEDFDFDDGEGEDTKARSALGGGVEGADGGAAGVSEEEEDSSDEDDDEDDDEAELLAELEKIKRERAEERQKKEQEAAEENMLGQKDEIMRGNPLLNIDGGAGEPDQE